MASINTLFGYNMNQTDTFRLIRQAGFKYGYRGPVSLEVKNFFYGELSIEVFLQIAFERAQKLESMLKLELRNRNNA